MDTNTGHGSYQARPYGRLGPEPVEIVYRAGATVRVRFMDGGQETLLAHELIGGGR